MKTAKKAVSIGAREPLTSELQGFVRPSGLPFGPKLLVHHPLCVDFVGDLSDCRGINRRFHAITEAVAEAKANEDWCGYIFLHERAYRLEAFKKVASLMTDAEYWACLAKTYTDLEGLHSVKRSILKLLRSQRPCRDRLMDDAERAALAQLPDVVTIYRGYDHRNGAKGISWTLSKDKADWFANRWGGRGAVVATGQVNKADILAHFIGRQEAEVVVDPRHITVLKEAKVASSRER